MKGYEWIVKYSIIIPVFNIEDYLPECIESVLNQRYQCLEIILVDDGSTDGSGKICDEYMNKDARIKVIHQQNKGQSSARNRAIQLAEGEYIIWLDGDDFLQDEAIECLDNLLEKQGKADVVVQHHHLYFCETNTIQDCNCTYDKQYETQSIEKIFQYMYDGLKYTSATWTITIKRRYLLDYQLYFKEGIKHEDSLWSPIAIMNAKKLLFNNNDFYIYRTDRVGSTMNTPKIKNLFDRFTVIEELLLESKKEKYSGKQSRLFEQLCGKMFIGLLIDIGYFAKDNANEYKSLLKMMKEKMWVLWTRKEPRYRVIYILCKLVGLNKVSRLLQLKQSYEKKQ